MASSSTLLGSALRPSPPPELEVEPPTARHLATAATRLTDASSDEARPSFDSLSVPQNALSGARSARAPSVTDRVLVAGRVVDATGGVIADARIVANSTAAPEEELAVSSDEQGRFVLELSSGPARLTVSAEAYAGVRQTVHAPARDLTLTLVPASGLRGVVLAEAGGQRLADVRVQLKSRDRIPELQRSTSSNAHGDFSFDELSSGQYEVSALDPRWRSEPELVTLGVADRSARVRPGDDVQRVLGPARYEQYRQVLHRHFEAQLLARGKPQALGYFQLPGGPRP